MIIYTDHMPDRFDGYNLGPVTLIRPAFRNDVGLHAHEAVHRAQFYRNPFMGLLYVFSADHRQQYEAEAYRAQLKFAPGKEALFAGYLAQNYNLNLTQADALALLT